ncbi:hypothetical protein RLOC_00005344 [Lonchura striata]|uniref:Uncharacterized protein n=1 Tax=Lonchura striata TaxID=40157 RepID=A0A218UKI7_9PASE|nr:hypothetical protein RLOC_00005344 [Lonchura striata domestica]
MEAPGPPAVRARSRRGGPSAPQRHARGAGTSGLKSYSMVLPFFILNVKQL